MLFKPKRQRINFGEWKKKVTITITETGSEIEVYKLPYRIGSSPNSDLVIDDLDPFQYFIVESNRKLYLVIQSNNLGSSNFGTGLKVEELSQSIQRRLGSFHAMIMPEIRHGSTFHFPHAKDNIILQCPYCGENFDVKEGCKLCGFGRPSGLTPPVPPPEPSPGPKSPNGSETNSKEKDGPSENGKETQVITTGDETLNFHPRLELCLVIESEQFKNRVFEIPVNTSSLTLTVGRSKDNNVDLSYLNDLTMSRHHCKLIIEGDKVFIEDIGSRNGTFVNGKLIKERIELNSFDEITLGSTRLKVEIRLKFEK